MHVCVCVCVCAEEELIIINSEELRGVEEKAEICMIW